MPEQRTTADAILAQTRGGIGEGKAGYWAATAEAETANNAAQTQSRLMYPQQ